MNIIERLAFNPERSSSGIVSQDVEYKIDFTNGSIKKLSVVPPTRDEILSLQNHMMTLEQIDLPLKHHFAPGVYGREILLPKGSLVIGKIHKHAHLNIISSGHVSVLTEFGRSKITGPYTFKSEPGTKRVVYAHEDTIWTTIHLTNETDLEKIEEEIIAKTYNDLDALTFAESMKLEESR